MSHVRPGQPTSLFEKILMSSMRYDDIAKNVVCETCAGNILKNCPQEGCLDGKVMSVYLRRFFIKRCKVKGKDGNIYLHHILRSDDDPDPHCHPWDFVTLILSGGYADEGWHIETFNSHEAIPKLQRFKVADEIVNAPKLISRKAEHVHRVILKNNKPAWTLVFTKPYRRAWGFFTQDSWIPWREYLNVPDDYEAD